MAAPSGFGPQVQQSIKVVSTMLEEFRYAEASVFLFHLNKWHVEEWGYVKDQLISNISSSSDLSILATILDCSAKSDLSSCNTIIPGLSAYTKQEERTDLFD